MEDYYQILGISPRATQLEIKRSFRKLAVLYHPDKNNSADSEDRFKEINRAYEVLNDPEKRAQYDISLAFPGRQTVGAPGHRDPAYRRRPPSYHQRQSEQTTKELMIEYLPKFRWACWAGLVLGLFVAIDFFLPYQNEREDIAEINRMYRTGRGGGTIYDHDELITKSGIAIYLHDDDILYFKKVRQIEIQRTGLFRKIVTASTPARDYKVKVAAIYAGLIFVPVMLFIASLLGVVLRKNVEFAFNFTIVSFILLIIVGYLLLR